VEAVRDILPRSGYMPMATRMPLLDWMQYVNISLRGRPYSTEKHEYLFKPLCDDYHDITFQKAAQVGVSTLVLIKSMWVAEHMGKKVVYYFQDDKAVQDFSSDRATPLIESSSYLSARMGTTDRVGLKQLGPGTIYFRGLQNKGKVKTIDCDMVVLDELNESPEANVVYAIDRLRHSDMGWVVALSQPSVPGFGINKRFGTTDQNHWHIKCSSCGHYNCLELDFPSHFKEIPSSQKKTFPDGATHYRGCSRCGARLNMSVGEWVAKHPNRNLRGYHISQLYTQIFPPGYPNIASKIMWEYRAKAGSTLGMENFTISVLGFPYSGASARVTDELLDFVEGDYPFTLAQSGCFMGIDQGDTLSVVIGMLSGQQFKVIYAEQTEKWDRLDFFMDKFAVHYCVIDAQPNKHSAKSFATRFPDRVSIQYFGSKSTKVSKELHEGRQEVNVISVDRTESIDRMLDKMEGGLILLPSRSLSDERGVAIIEDLRRHLKRLVTKTEISSRGVPVRTYISGPGLENHYGMALNSAVLAAYELGVMPGPMVTPIFSSIKIGRA